MCGVPEGPGQQRYVITYRKTKLAAIESTALYALLVAKLINVR